MYNGCGTILFGGFVMLIITSLAYRLASYCHSIFLGGPLPEWLLAILIAFCVLVCSVNFLNRAAFEGYLTETGKTSFFYEVYGQKLQLTAYFCFFFALTFIWVIASRTWGWIWVCLYFAAEIAIRNKAEKRLLEYRFVQAMRWFPEMTEVEQRARAEAWVRSGLDPIEFEMQNHK